MLRVLFYLACLTALGYGALWLAEHPGRVTIDWMDYRITTLLSVLVFVVLGLITLFIAISLLIREIITAPRRARMRRALRQKDDGLLALTHSLSALALGDHSVAEKQLTRAKRYLQDAPVTLLLSAQIARIKGQGNEITFSAMLDSPETRAVGLRGMIEQAMKNKHYDQAADHAREAYQLRPKDRWLTLILLDLHCRRQRWADALEIVKNGARYSLFDHDTAKRYDGLIHYERARHALSKDEEDTAIALLILSRKAWPEFMPSANLLVQLYAKHDERALTGRQLQRIWQDAPNPIIVDTLLERLSDLSAAKLVKQIEKLVEANRDHPESQMALARAAIQTSQWDIARNHLKAALSRRESARIYQLFAEIETQELGDEAAAGEWLRRAVEAPKEPEWVCSVCGHHTDDWNMHCTSCQSFDSYIWDTPERKTELLAS